MAWVDPRQLTDEQLAAEIKALEPKIVELEPYFRRRWELLQEQGARRQQVARKAAWAETCGEDRGKQQQEESANDVGVATPSIKSSRPLRRM